jgi:hypothetical protein
MEDQPLYTIHAQSVGELEYALEFAKCGGAIIGIERA